MFVSAMAQLFLAGVFLASGAGKLRSPGSVAAAVSALGLPASLGRGPLARAFPWCEIALGAALLLVWTPFGAVPALVSALLCAAFAVLVGRAVARGASESCSCFGAEDGAPMSWHTVARNVCLVLLSLAAAAGRLASGSLDRDILSGQGALAAVVVAVLAAGVWFLAASVGAGPRRSAEHRAPEAAGADAAAGQPLTRLPAVAEPADGEPADYVRRPNPLAFLEGVSEDTPDVLTSHLYESGPVVALIVSPYCGPCLSLREEEDRLRELLPDVLIVYILGLEDSTLPEHWKDSPFPVYRDPHDVFVGSVAPGGTPALVLLGTDGMLAAGPEYGPSAIMETAEEIAAVLAEQGSAPQTAAPLPENDDDAVAPHPTETPHPIGEETP
ncbi:MauE/DoxX family redox-associated membrane protein [Arthrobacter sp. UM1]|uniref:MauE/DoxX family redox-associated membrane protein n=1 Tax=Arthrobacter sp. UM1 TaxID=2766776 RepID=UPI001CF6FD04|nr:MauE/DoxX family redox-associated membrane protein [Arthrobacter sp. UM1]MCB4208012.1 hypothetical protein [Arthrobacter sp. UM1]